MNKRLPPTDVLDEFLNDLAEDALRLSDQELRTELLEDGGSLDDDSERFRAAFRTAESRLPDRPSPWEETPTAAGVREIRDLDTLFMRWRSRPVRRYTGSIEALLDHLPRFRLAPFRAEAEMLSHPRLAMVVREPENNWREMAVGTVSRRYTLVQHHEAVTMCLHGLERALGYAGPGRNDLRGELTLTIDGDLMDFTFVLPDEYSFVDADGHTSEFRCNVSNGVEGSARLDVRFDWFRQVCSNGMIAVVDELWGKSWKHLGLHPDSLEDQIVAGIRAAARSRATLNRWQEVPVSPGALGAWADTHLERAWGAHAAGRVYNICRSGHDVRFPSGAANSPTALVGREAWRETRTRRRVRVPGSPEVARTAYDVAQAMSWVASQETNRLRRIHRQGQIPALVERLRAA